MSELVGARILVTGANGFLGRHVCRNLVAAGCHVHAAIRPHRAEPEATVKIALDLLGPPAATSLALRGAWDVVVHCAAEVPGTSGAYDDEQAALRSEGMVHALLSALPPDTPLICISSMTVYGHPNGRPWMEQDAGAPESAYGRGKSRAETMLRAGRCRSVALRLPGLFGGQRESGLVFNLARSLSEGKALYLPKSPVVWAAVHVEDAAAAIVRLVDWALSVGFVKTRVFDAVHVAYDEPYAIDSFARQLAGHFGKTLDYCVSHPVVRFDLSRAREMGLEMPGTLLGATVFGPGGHDVRY